MLPHKWFDVFGALGFVNLCVNPIIYAARIYAARYEMFKRSLARMLQMDNAVGGHSMATSAV